MSVSGGRPASCPSVPAYYFWRPMSSRLRYLPAVLCALFLSACGTSGKGKTAYVGASVLDGNGGAAIADAVIIVNQGRIALTCLNDGFESSP